MITIKYTVNGMRSLSGARSVELTGKHNDDDDDDWPCDIQWDLKFPPLPFSVCLQVVQ